MLKNRLFRFAYCSGVMRSRPALTSIVAPVRFWYLLKTSEANIRSVLPVSTIPAELRIVSPDP